MLNVKYSNLRWVANYKCRNQWLVAKYTKKMSHNRSLKRGGSLKPLATPPTMTNHMGRYIVLATNRKLLKVPLATNGRSLKLNCGVVNKEKGKIQREKGSK
jgi:hypothetical protein